MNGLVCVFLVWLWSEVWSLKKAEHSLQGNIVLLPLAEGKGLAGREAAGTVLGFLGEALSRGLLDADRLLLTDRLGDVVDFVFWLG